MLVGIFGLDFAVGAPGVWTGLFSKHLVGPYITICVGLYLCFAIGDTLGVHIFRRQTINAPRVPTLVLSVVTIIACVLAIYTAITLRDQLARPYGTALTFNPARGRVMSYIVLLGIVALIYAIDRPQMPWNRLLRSRYFLPFLIGSLLFVWAGTRLYAASFVLIFAVYQSNFRQRFRMRTILGWSAALALLFGIVGVWRAEERLGNALLNEAQESVQPSISLLYYLHSKGIAWTNSPIYLASDFANLVPWLLLPDKASLIKRLPVYSPLGAMNSFVSFNINFGVVGTAIFLFLLAFSFRYLRSRSSSTLFATMYTLCAGWMAFTFFRDPFKISLVKAIVQDSILIPVVIVGFGRLLTGACSAPARSAAIGPEAWSESR